ncbi:MAG: hypothetical protein LW860_04160 [Xanthomonadaceae bacterium]|jgi:hypothetical protein|nr:hypothetical protein [Xanthomonadaceae bacterium]
MESARRSQRHRSIGSHGSAACSALSRAPGADKASLLDALRGRVRVARIPDGCTVPRGAWQSNRAALERALPRAVGGARFAVRSARPGEDAVGAGGAGRYHTALDIPAEHLGAAVDAVFASYGAPRAGDQVLVQRFVAGIEAALVAASHAPGDGAPYRCISRAIGIDPAAITAGTAAADTLYVAHAARGPVPRWARPALALLTEVGALAGGSPFELELVRARGRLWLLQFRPLAAPCVDAAAVRAARSRAQRGLARAAAPRAIRPDAGLESGRAAGRTPAPLGPLAVRCAAGARHVVAGSRHARLSATAAQRPVGRHRRPAVRRCRGEFRFPAACDRRRGRRRGGGACVVPPAGRRPRAA